MTEKPQKSYNFMQTNVPYVSDNSFLYNIDYILDRKYPMAYKNH